VITFAGSPTLLYSLYILTVDPSSLGIHHGAPPTTSESTSNSPNTIAVLAATAGAFPATPRGEVKDLMSSTDRGAERKTRSDQA
jgi:hypothetical protein